MRHKSLNLILIIVLLAISGCATVDQKMAEPSTSDTASPDNKTIIFGKLDNFKDGKPEKLAWGYDHFILIQAEGVVKGLPVKIDRDGWFFLNLQPGNYAIRGVLSGPTTIFLNERFSVSEGNAAVYVGNIVLDKRQAMFSLRTINAEQAAIEEFNKRYLQSRFQPETRLMQTEPEIGKFKAQLGICATKWGLDCTMSVQGIEPVDPPLEHGLKGITFTDIDSLQPTMRWKPSPAPTVTFDLAIWEATSYRINSLVTRYLPGDLVLYQEKLSKPEFTLETPLKPKSKYFWSVRLRDEDTVSSWSKAGHFTFLIVGWTSGTGEWFAFETP